MRIISCARNEPVLVLAVLAHLVIGACFVWSGLSIPNDLQARNYGLFVRHLSFIVVALTIGFVIWRHCSGDRLKRYGAWFGLGAVTFSVLPFFPGLGLEFAGAFRSIAVGTINIPTFPFVALCQIVFVSAWLTNKREPIPISRAQYFLGSILLGLFLVLPHVTAVNGLNITPFSRLVICTLLASGAMLSIFAALKFLCSLCGRPFAAIEHRRPSYSFWLAQLCLINAYLAQSHITGLLFLIAIALVLCWQAKQWVRAQILFYTAAITTFFYLSTNFNSDRWTRIRGSLGFAEDWAARYADGYQTSTSLVGVNAGGLWGIGFGDGILKAILPRSMDHFIFATVIEEVGALPAIALAALSLVVVWRCMAIATRLKSVGETFSQLLVVGFSFWFAISFVGHISAVLGLSPMMTPYPLISFGGFYIITFVAGFAIVLKLRDSLVDYEKPVPTTLGFPWREPLVASIIITLVSVSTFALKNTAVDPMRKEQYLALKERERLFHPRISPVDE